MHKEPPSAISPNGFKRFLCNSPLQRKTAATKSNNNDSDNDNDDDNSPQLLGSYHQCYRLDGRLIAMGVLDLLPHCVSGVYFLYHSDYERFNLGKLSAVREAVLALEGGYQYYYMGFYIHSCAKMRYKGEFRPQYVLDPESLEWDPLEGEVRALLDRKRYVSLARERRRRRRLLQASSAENQKIKRQAEEEEEKGQEKQKQEERRGKEVEGTENDEEEEEEEEEEESGEGQQQEEEEEDTYPDFPFPTPTQADHEIRKGASLFTLKIPGVMSAEEIEQSYPLGQQRISARGKVFVAEVSSFLLLLSLS